MNRDGFEAFYRAHSRDVLAYLVRRAVSPEDAADCLAETFLIAWDKRDQLPSEARPWLFGVARNVLRRDRERTDRADAAVTGLARKLADRPVAEPAPDPALTGALDELSSLDREIITLMAWEGMTPREVAAVVNLSPNVVRVRAHRARARLRQELLGRADSDKAADRAAL